jgi:serine/threonine protein phosphatase 1
MIVIGDCHGCYHTLLDLMSKLPSGHKIYTVGDGIDRGNYSYEVVDLFLNKRILPVLGNHESMMEDYYNNKDKYTWIHNGGDVTIESYRKYGYNNVIDNKEHYDFLVNSPKYIQVNNILISHSMVGKWQTFKEAVDSNDIMWNRGEPNIPEGCYHIFGHTPMEVMVLMFNWANIDTGCVFGNKLSAIVIDENRGKILDTISIPMNPKDKTRWSIK